MSYNHLATNHIDFNCFSSSVSTATSVILLSPNTDNYEVYKLAECKIYYDFVYLFEPDFDEYLDELN